VRSPRDELRFGNTFSCYEYGLARSLVRQTREVQRGGLMPLRLSISGLVAISFLTTILSFRYLHAASIPAGASRDDRPNNPVLVELFTSEGCSSCPPADALLERLDRSQPVSGVDLIVLSEHVDYWNDIGWKDPYSSHEYSERQSAYAVQFGLGSIYTPQMIVDGHFEFVGSDERRAKEAIANATKVMKTPVSISSSLSNEKTPVLHIETGPLPSPSTAESAAIFLAIADDSDESHVSRGENAGRTLKHVAVLRNLIRIGAIDKSGGFSRDMKLDLNGKNPRNLRIAVIVQEADAGRVWGAGFARFSN
jgi:hypothetical protein